MSTPIDSRFSNPINTHIQQTQKRENVPMAKEADKSEAEKNIDTAASLMTELRNMTDVREEKVELGKRILADENYLTDENLDKIAGALLSDISKLK